MTRLTDTQLVILSEAAKRDSRALLPFPTSLKARGAAAQKVLASLVSKNLAEPMPAGPQDTVWREEEGGCRMTLRITDAGLAAIGLGDADSSAAGKARRNAKLQRKGRKGKPSSGKSNGKRARQSTGAPAGKGDAIIAMLRRKTGASIDEMSKTTGWQAHSVRGFLSGTVKKKLGLTVTSEKDGSGVRRYRIAGGRS